MFCISIHCLWRLQVGSRVCSPEQNWPWLPVNGSPPCLLASGQSVNELQSDKSTTTTALLSSNPGWILQQEYCNKSTPTRILQEEYCNTVELNGGSPLQCTAGLSPNWLSQAPLGQSLQLLVTHKRCLSCSESWERTASPSERRLIDKGQICLSLPEKFSLRQKWKATSLSKKAKSLRQPSSLSMRAKDYTAICTYTCWCTVTTKPG